MAAISTAAVAILQRQSELAQIRANWEPEWQDIVDYILPRRGDILARGTKGGKRGRKIYDSTATDAADILAAALHGMLTNPMVPWFALAVPDFRLMQDREVRMWLDDTTNRILYYLAQSNFVTRIHEHYTDLVGFGTSSLYCQADQDIFLNFSVPYISQIFIAENNKGMVDTVHRVSPWTARQMIQEWGVGSVSPKVRLAMDKNPEEEFDVVHAVFPRTDKMPSLDSKGKPFASFYIEKESHLLLSESGYDQLPYMSPRWHLMSGESYGRSPGMKALPDVKMLQAIVKAGLKAQQKAVDPPIQVPDNTVVSRLRMYPGGLNYYRSGSQDRIEAVGNQGAQVPLGLQVEDRWRMAIRRTFLNDQLQLGQDNPQMTATEVVKRSEDQLRVLGPIAGRLFSELLNPLIDRVLTILLDSGLVMPPPKQLHGKIYNVNYISPIAKAQKATELKSFSRFMELVSPFAQADPSVLDVLDVDYVVRMAADDLGVPTAAIRPQEEVDQKREERQQLLQAKEGAATMQNLSRGVKNLGGTNPETLQKLAGMAGVNLPNPPDASKLPPESQSGGEPGGSW